MINLINLPLYTFALVIIVGLAASIYMHTDHSVRMLIRYMGCRKYGHEIAPNNPTECFWCNKNLERENITR